MKGKVFLVGAGPGDFGLITLKGLECIQKADVILYDRLANDALLKEAKEDCKFLYVGKESGNHTKTQDEINSIIANSALDGSVVTRLKGGDPYVFGRGGEEANYLYDRGIDFEVVPGISSSIGGLTYAGIPITQRGYASSFHVITGHLKDEREDLNWSALAGLDGTLVFLMGMKNLERICKSLIGEGKDKKTPVAIINWASRPYQRVVTGDLETIKSIVDESGIKNPSLIVVGEVVNLREKLDFFEKKPLFGKNIVVTRARKQSSRLSNKLYELGANPIELPVIEIKPCVDDLEFENIARELEKYSYIMFTSRNGVDIFFSKLFEMGLDTRALGKAKVVVVGSETAKIARKYGVVADIMPKKYVAEEIVKVLKPLLKSNDNILIPRARVAREDIVNQLCEICNVKEMKIYETVRGDVNREDIMNCLEDNDVDYITFTSSSTAENFVEILGKEYVDKMKDVKIFSIGPITTNTVINLGLEVYDEANIHTIDGLVDSILRHS